VRERLIGSKGRSPPPPFPFPPLRARVRPARPSPPAACRGTHFTYSAEASQMKFLPVGPLKAPLVVAETALVKLAVAALSRGAFVACCDVAWGRGGLCRPKADHGRGQ